MTTPLLLIPQERRERCAKICKFVENREMSAEDRACLVTSRKNDRPASGVTGVGSVCLPAWTQSVSGIGVVGGGPVCSPASKQDRIDPCGQLTLPQTELTPIRLFVTSQPSDARRRRAHMPSPPIAAKPARISEDGSGTAAVEYPEAIETLLTLGSWKLDA